MPVLPLIRLEQTGQLIGCLLLALHDLLLVAHSQRYHCHLTVLGGLAEFERDLIRARTSEGRERARARGVRMGRPPELTRHQRQEALRRRNRGTDMLADIARSYNVSPTTISRLGAMRAM